MPRKVMNHERTQSAMRQKNLDQLRYIAQDALAAAQAMTNGENEGYYLDEYHYAVMELTRRQNSARAVSNRVFFRSPAASN